MMALIRAMAAPEFPAEPALVVSNNPAAGGLEKAHALGVETCIVDHRDFGGDRTAFDAALTAALAEAAVDLVAEAGFMRIHAPGFPEHWAGRILNIHPSLLPAFPGLGTHEKALAAGVAVHGCTVHEVTPELDAGPILGQAVVPVQPGDTPQTLGARVLAQEHRLYPAALAAFARDPEAARNTKIALLAP